MNTLLRDMLPDAPEFSENERDAISTLAFSCPYTHGNAVYKARVLYARFAPPAHYDELVICNSQGVIKTAFKLDDLIYTLNNTTKKNAWNLEDDLVKLYPNPTHQNLTIEGDNLKTIRITDLLGREVFRTELQAKQVVIKLNCLYYTLGVYLYTIHTINDTKSGKLLIE
ncbi:MAG: T9SS type A sorting domain-containing protein [Bacteroidetes bacterium]|nr:T9SS type A sorting domain-containing protein [Bacteroidota bacterium]